MRKFSVRPTLTIRGRKFKGLRGWAGKPFHPPFTDFPVAAYIIAAVFDIVSAVGGTGHARAREFWHAGTYVFISGAIVSLLAALTGFWDWWKSSEPGTQARRTINTHAWTMITVTVLALIDIVVRLAQYHTRSATPGPVLILSIVVALLVSFASLYGGALVYEYGFNVETSGDHPVWHRSEEDVLPGAH